MANWAIKAKILPETATKPTRIKFSNGHNTITKEFCKDGDTVDQALKICDDDFQRALVYICKRFYAPHALGERYAKSGYMVAHYKAFPQTEYVLIAKDL